MRHFISLVLSMSASVSLHAAQLTATSSTFQSVMATAVGGDSVKLSGNFGRTDLYNRNFSSLVAIDASDASFNDTFVMNNVSNVAFTGGSYGSKTARTAWGRAVVVYGGNNVSFTNPHVSGFYGDQGLFFGGTTNVRITGATLSKLDAGIVFGNVTGGSITNSNSIGSTSDGIDIANSSYIDVGYNTCTGGTPTAGAHPDCVQLWSSPGNARQSHISIHNNYASGDTQGFTNFASYGIGSDYISIMNNRVDGLMPQGIACYSCANSTITGNILNSLSGAEYQVLLRTPGGTNNTISGNTIGAFSDVTAKPTVFYVRQQLIDGLVHAPTFAMPPSIVPEPAVWAMMIAGFAMVGLGQRQRHGGVDAWRSYPAITPYVSFATSAA